MQKSNVLDVLIDLRFADFDAFRHVNNAVYFTFMETARYKLIREDLLELSARGILMVVGTASCEYRLPISMDNNTQVTVSVWISRLGNSSFDLGYLIHDGAGKSFATAKTTMICFDTVNKVPVAVPERIRELYSAAGD
ncbi:MAG: acyl-CoA thioesterase [Dissulfurispiraceae bacterium]